MKNIEEIREKLKLIYFDAMQLSNIYTKDEAIELFMDSDFSEEEYIFIQKSDFQAKNKDDALFDFCNQENCIEYSEDTLEEIIECDENDYFFINISCDNSYEKTSKLLYNQIKQEFNATEFPLLIQLLKDDCINFNKKYRNKIDYEFEYIENILHDSNLYNRFINEQDFGEEMLLIYINNYEESDREKTIQLSQKIIEKPEIITLNDMIRRTFTYMFNKAISIGVMPMDVVLIIREYLNGKLTMTDLQELYKNIGYNNFDFVLISKRNYIKRIMISDYCRFKQLQIENNLIDEMDIEQLSFIEKHDINTIISNFNHNNHDFATNIIIDFLHFNSDFDLEIKKKYNSNDKVLKKINPCYKLDFINFSQKKPKID